MQRVFALIALLGAAACSVDQDLARGPAPLGDFQMGHNIVVAPDPLKGPASRDASKDELIESMTAAIDERFGRYEGDKLYHFGISVDAYVLAQPGIPIVFSPKSVLILNVTVWDDAAGKKLNEEPHRITALETISGETFIGSGLTQSKEVQLRNLSRNAARLIQNWMIKQAREEGWFGGPEAMRAAIAAQEAENARVASEAQEAAAAQEAQRAELEAQGQTAPAPAE